MKNWKKIVITLLFLVLIGGLTSCSQMNKVTKYFEEQDYVRYKYNNRGGSLLFSVHDALALEEAPETTEDLTATTTAAETTAVDTSTTEEELAPEYLLRFMTYSFSNGDNVAVVIEFDSEDYLLELLDTSPTLMAEFEGLDPLDYINGNCLLICDESIYDEMVEIFQGRAEPLVEDTTLETTTVAETTTDTETTTVAAD